MDSTHHTGDSRASSGSCSDLDLERAWSLIRVSGSDPAEIALWPFPFVVGRRPGCSLQLNSKSVSGHHAEFSLIGNGLWVSDLTSTNGTFVNGQRIRGQTELFADDLVQFANLAFRVGGKTGGETAATMREDVCDSALSLVQFDRMMDQRLVTPYSQPIVQFSDDQVFAFEILARSSLFGMESSDAMFTAASQLNMEVELSRMLRWEAVLKASAMSLKPTLFVNTHPLELRDEGLLDSLAKVRSLCDQVPLVLEIHEAAVTQPSEMLQLKKRLEDLGIRIAYDDFGAGQTRLSELIEAPPDYLKFDISLIHEIDQASRERQRTLGALVRVALDLGVVPLAEGVEAEGEATTCRQLGFTAAQGFYFGRPIALGEGTT